MANSLKQKLNSNLNARLKSLTGNLTKSLTEENAYLSLLKLAIFGINDCKRSLFRKRLKSSNQPMDKKLFLLLFFSFYLSACATIVYSPAHKLIEESLEPVRVGVVEYTILKHRVVSPPPFVIKDKNIAFKKAEIEAKQKIKEFCKSDKWTTIRTSKETRHDGFRGHGATYNTGAYLSFTSVKMVPVYKMYKKITFKCGENSAAI